MANFGAALIIILFLNNNYVSSSDSDFTKIGKLQHRSYPFKWNDKLHFMAYNIERKTWFISSTDPSDEECYLPNLDIDPSSILVLGSGKLLVISKYVTHLNIIEECPDPFITSISDGKAYKSIDARYNRKNELGYVVVYNNTFDVFDRYQKTCMPCRYNDEGEKLRVNCRLEQQFTKNENHAFSLEIIKDGFGGKNAYLYIFKYPNGETIVRILDSKFNVVNQRRFARKIEAYSLDNKNLTICFIASFCREDPPDTDKCVETRSPYCRIHFTPVRQTYCEYAECHMLNSDLKTIVNVKLYQNPMVKENIVKMTVKNLNDGGAMVGMMFITKPSEDIERKYVFIQRIHADGRSDLPIRFDSFDDDVVDMYDFTFDNGEYCLVTVNMNDAKGNYTFVKCLNTVEDYVDC